MKVRNDFVTNSSSSSFIIARKGKLNEKQRDLIADYVENLIFGYGKLDEIEQFEQYMEQYCLDPDYKPAIEKELADDKTVYFKSVSFHDDGPFDFIVGFYLNVFKILAEHGDGNFEVISADFYY